MLKSVMNTGHENQFWQDDISLDLDTFSIPIYTEVFELYHMAKSMGAKVALITHRAETQRRVILDILSRCGAEFDDAVFCGGNLLNSKYGSSLKLIDKYKPKHVCFIEDSLANLMEYMRIKENKTVASRFFMVNCGHIFEIKDIRAHEYSKIGKPSFIHSEI
jgi:hypothetical protein